MSESKQRLKRQRVLADGCCETLRPSDEVEVEYIGAEENITIGEVHAIVCKPGFGCNLRTTG
jgi:hypothetical protein